MTIEQSLDALQAVSRAWREGGYQQRYGAALAAHGGYLSSDAEEEAEHLGQALTRACLESYFAKHAGAEAALAELGQREPEPAIFVLGSGNIGIPLVMNVALGLIARKRVYARASRTNAAAVEVWLEALHDSSHGASREMAERVSMLELDYAGDQYHAALASLPIQQAYLWGGDLALSETRRAFSADAPVRVYEFGPRTGVLLLESRWWSALAEDDKRQTAQACYDNLLKYDAALCSTPTFAVVVGSEREARHTVSELALRMVPADGERARLERLPGANAYRRQLRQWQAFGYTLHRPEGSLVTLAVGSAEAFEGKQRFASEGFSYYDSAGSLELVSYATDRLADAADQVAHLQDLSRYRGLWSVGHIITLASHATTEAFIRQLAACQQSHEQLRAAARLLPADQLRVVDLRENLGRTPGEPFDGIDLVETMLAPS